MTKLVQKKRKLLITGGGGLLALNWACTMRQEWDVVLGIHQRSVCLKNVLVTHLNLDSSDGTFTPGFVPKPNRNPKDFAIAIVAEL